MGRNAFLGFAIHLRLYRSGKNDEEKSKETKAVAPQNVPMSQINDYSGYYPYVEYGKFDNGKMWTFSYPPVQYFKETYGFTPSEEWLENMRMSALRFSTYCTASFVSEDGLVMTNHHCGRQSVTEVTKDGEDLLKMVSMQQHWKKRERFRVFL